LPDGNATSTDGQQVRPALYNGETEAEASAALARRSVELWNSSKNRLKFALPECQSRYPYLDAQLVARTAGSEQDLALIGLYFTAFESSCGSSVRAGVDRCAR